MGAGTSQGFDPHLLELPVLVPIMAPDDRATVNAFTCRAMFTVSTRASQREQARKVARILQFRP